MQAVDGLSLDAQRKAITDYCCSHDLRLVKIYEDVESGGKAERPGLNAALASRAAVVIVLKFDRLSRSIKHFCEVFDRHFADGRRELVAIREAIRLDSALGRALVNILLVFAQMEREATGERTRESIAFIRSGGYHHGKVPYGYKAVAAPDNPRYRILVSDPAEQAVLTRVKAMLDSGIGISEIAQILNNEGVAPPQSQRWSKSLIYNLRLRMGWHHANRANEREHSDNEVKSQIWEMRNQGKSFPAIANILNELGYRPFKGRRFTKCSVRKLLGNLRETDALTPKAFCESVIAKAGGKPPGYHALARALTAGGFSTPKGNANWWPAQVRELMRGAYDSYYVARAAAPAGVS